MAVNNMQCLAPQLCKQLAYGCLATTSLTDQKHGFPHADAFADEPCQSPHTKSPCQTCSDGCLRHRLVVHFVHSRLVNRHYATRLTFSISDTNYSLDHFLDHFLFGVFSESFCKDEVSVFRELLVRLRLPAGPSEQVSRCDVAVLASEHSRSLTASL